MEMSFEEYAESIGVSPFVHSDKAVVNIRLHSSLLEEAFRNWKALSTARVTRASCQHHDLTRSVPRCRVQPAPQVKLRGLI